MELHPETDQLQYKTDVDNSMIPAGAAIASGWWTSGWPIGMQTPGPCERNPHLVCVAGKMSWGWRPVWLALNANESQLALLDVTGTLRFLSWPPQQQDRQISPEVQAGIKVWSCPRQYCLGSQVLAGRRACK